METDEWKSRMTSYDTAIETRLNAQDDELSLDEVFTDRWNSLSVDITKEDDEFTEELKRYK